MKIAIATAVSAAALAVLAGPAAAGEPEVEIRNAVARVSVIVEDRADVAVEVQRGRSALPAIQISRHGDEVRIDGGLGGRRSGRLFSGLSNRIRECHSGRGDGLPGEGAWVQVRDIGRVDLADAPLIIIRTPRRVDVSAEGAVFGAIGRGARSVDLANGGCGRWDVANVDGAVSLSLGGSGDIRAGNAREMDIAIGGSGSVAAGATNALDISIGGSGSVRAGATRRLEVAIGGSGDVAVARLDGNLDVAIGGSGDVDVRGGSAPKVDVAVAGSGDVRFRGTAGDVDVTVMGSGDVTIDRATGSVSRQVAGGGDVHIGH
ncbi:GIN domain-containing protein [Brevundimonas sp. FT23028]|uniref:GIN domain-containing protein n=1 Tax=Brevundimonas sp. FT23028 TaxID=3393748 RepID=UPI003B58909D